MLNLGLDLGSTTVKYVLLDSNGARLAATTDDIAAQSCQRWRRCWKSRAANTTNA